jgi:LysM repeat protein
MVTIPYWFIRYGLPAGFLLLATVAILLMRHAIHAEESAPAPSTTVTTAARAVPKRAQVRRAQASAYSVRSGDTLGAIAERFGTTVDALIILNPDVDPRALRVGQTLRVAR